MTERGCPVCGAEVGSDATFCHVCGAQLDAAVVETASSTEEIESAPSRLRVIAVPLAVAAVLALGITALVTGGDANDEADAVEDSLEPIPTAEPSPTPAPEPSPSEPARPTPTATRRTSDAVPSELDPATVATIEASHLVLSVGTDVAFLDLDSGNWTVRKRAGQVPSRGPTTALLTAGNGLLTEESNGHIRHVPVMGPVQSIGGGRVIGVIGDRIWLDPFANSRQPVRVLDTSGTVLEEISLPAETWPTGVLPDGSLVITGGGGIFVLRGAEVVDLGRGEARGVIAGSVLRFRCGDNANCGYELVDPISGASTPLDPTLDDGFGVGFPVLTRDDRIHIYGETTVRTYSVADNTAELDHELSLFDFDAQVRTGDAFDPSGTSVGVRDELVVVWSADGEALVELDPPISPSAFLRTTVAFVDLDG